MEKQNEKQIIIRVGEKLEIDAKDLTLNDVIKGLVLLSGVVKEAAKNNENVNYKEIMNLVDTLSDEIVEGNNEES
jgi:hypothetical protein